MIKKITTGATTLILLAIIVIGFVGTSPNAQAQEAVESDALANFVALMQYIRSEPTPSDIKAENIPLLAAVNNGLSRVYTTGFITPFTGETPEQVEARLQSIPEEDRFIAVLVESYRLAPDSPLLLDLIHRLLPLYYAELFTTAADLNAASEFLNHAEVARLAAAFDSADYAIPAPAVSGPVSISPSTRTSGDVGSDALAGFAALMQYIHSEPTPSDIKAENILLLAAVNNGLSQVYITGFITPFTGETPEQVEARLQSIPEEDRFIAVLVESYRLAPNSPLLLDLIHRLLPLYYAELFTTAEDLNAASEFLNHTEVARLAAAFDSADYAIPAPSAQVSSPTATATPVSTPTATATPVSTPTATATPTIAELVKNVESGVVQIISTDGSGSGFIIDVNGRVVTNEHVVRGNQSVTVRMFDGKEYQASVLGVDVVADLAVVDMNGGDNLRPVPLGDSDLVQVGEEVIAIGYPLGFQLGESQTVSRGIISALRPNHFGTGVDYLQTDAAINPGNSGGPLFNRAGQAIGVNTLREFVSSDGRPVDNIAFAVAINDLKARLENLTSGENAPIVTPDASPTPVATPSATTDWRWDKWTSDGSLSGSWSISIPPDWSFLSEDSGEGYQSSYFEADDNSALVSVSVFPNIGSLGLDEFAQTWKSASESWGAENYPLTYRVTSFEKKADRGGREFYSLHEEYFHTGAGCWVYGIDHIFTDFNYGAITRGSICHSGGRSPSNEDWGNIPEILDSFELHHYSFVDIYRNNLYGHSVDLGIGYYLSEDSETQDFSFFWGFEGSDRVAFLNIWTLEAISGQLYELRDFAIRHREFAISYADEQGWPLFQVRSLTRHSKTSPIDGVTRQWYEFKYRMQISASSCVEDVTELIILEDSKARSDIGYIVAGSVCEGHMTKWGPRRDAALDSFRP